MEIKFANEFDKYINDNKIECEIIINYDLPYYLRIPDECMEFNISDSFFSCLPKLNRKMVIKTERKFNENQAIAIRHSTFAVGTDSYGFESTSVIVLIEITNEEIEYINEIFKDNEFLIELMRKSLEVLLIKYNSCMNGNHFVTPSPVDCSMISVMLFRNWLQFKESINLYISPNSISSQNYKGDEFTYTSSLNINMYKYFFNKAKYSMSTYDYIDTIVSSAISLESYIHHIIRLNIEDEKQIKQYTKYENKNKELSVFKLLKKIEQDSFIEINKTMDNSKLGKLIRRVLDPRNDLMHGKLVSIMGLDKLAKESCNSLIEIYDNIKINKQDTTNYNITDNRIRISYSENQAKSFINKGLADSKFENKIASLEEALKYDESHYMPYLAMGNELLNLGKVDEAILLYDKCLEKTHLKDEIYFNLAMCYYLKNDYYEAIGYLGKVRYTHKGDEYSFSRKRFYKIYGRCYLLVSNEKENLCLLGINRDEASKLSIEYLRKSIALDDKYIPAYLDLMKLYIDINEFELCVELCTKLINGDTDHIVYHIYRAYGYLYMDMKEPFVDELNYINIFKSSTCNLIYQDTVEACIIGDLEINTLIAGLLELVLRYSNIM